MATGRQSVSIGCGFSSLQNSRQFPQSAKVALWWNQEVKDAIRAKTAAYKTWLQNKA